MEDIYNGPQTGGLSKVAVYRAVINNPKDVAGAIVSHFMNNLIMTDTWTTDTSLGVTLRSGGKRTIVVLSPANTLDSDVAAQALKSQLNGVQLIRV